MKTYRKQLSKLTRLMSDAQDISSTVYYFNLVCRVENRIWNLKNR